MPAALLSLVMLGAGLSDMTVAQTAGTVELEWADTEERVTATLAPAPVVAGRAFEVLAHVGSFYGADFTGPVQMTLKGPSGQRESKSVVRPEGVKAWAATFVPAEPGSFTLDFQFSTTRNKTVRATLEVGPTPLPRWPWYVLVGLAGVGMAAYAVRSLFKSEQA